MGVENQSLMSYNSVDLGEGTGQEASSRGLRRVGW